MGLYISEAFAFHNPPPAFFPYINIDVCETHVFASDVAQNAQTTAGTLSLPSARNGA